VNFLYKRVLSERIELLIKRALSERLSYISSRTCRLVFIIAFLLLY